MNDAVLFYFLSREYLQVLMVNLLPAYLTSASLPYKNSQVSNQSKDKKKKKKKQPRSKQIKLLKYNKLLAFSFQFSTKCQSVGPKKAKKILPKHSL